MLAPAAIAVAVALALGSSAADRLHPYSAVDPDAESTLAIERVHKLAGLDPDAGLVALVETERPVRTEVSRRRVERIADQIFLDPAVAFVITYWSGNDPGMVARDGHATFVIAHFATLSDRAQQIAAERLRRRFAGDSAVSFGGEAPTNVEAKEIVKEDLIRAQILALPLLLALGFWFFRGLLAAMLPLGVGLTAAALSLLALRIANAVAPISVFALNLVLGLTLALAVDYSLLMIYRFREELARGASPEEALHRTLGTAGRTVLFSSLVVGAALASLLAFPQRFLYSMGLGGLLVALASGLGALTILPALLALLGERVNALSPQVLQRTADHEARPAGERRSYRLAQLAMRKPWRVAGGTATALVVLGLPFLTARFLPIETDVLPAEAESRQVREDLTERFPPTLTLPLYVVTEQASGRQARALARQIRRLPGVARADRPVDLGERTSLIRAATVAPPLDPGAAAVVRKIRATPTRFGVLVGGRAADHLDQKAGIARRLPLVLALMCAAVLVVLFLMIDSLVLAAKAVLMSLLSLCAAFGVLVFVFQEGRLESLLDYTSVGALELSMPLVLLAAGFGVSTDYGVILLSRIKEAHDEGAEDREAVPLGIERSARILTAAALMVAVALGALVVSRIAFVKELGVGIALTVLIDATVVRMLLVPSLMALLGRWNWWSPKPLRQLRARLTGRT